MRQKNKELSWDNAFFNIRTSTLSFFRHLRRFNIFSADTGTRDNRLFVLYNSTKNPLSPRPSTVEPTSIVYLYQKTPPALLQSRQSSYEGVSTSDAHRHLRPGSTRPRARRCLWSTRNMTSAAPLVCHGHSRPIVNLEYSQITEDGVFLISSSKGGLFNLHHFFLVPFPLRALKRRNDTNNI